MKINPKSIYIIAKKEFTDNIRNNWIVGLTILFVVLTLFTSFFAGGKEGGSAFGGLENTVVTLMSIANMLIPLIAIMLGYATISGECESGSMYLVLSYPLRRLEVVLGKFLGLASVLIFSTVLGFGSGGILIMVSAGTSAWSGYLVFILLTILVGLLYLSMSMFFSTLTSKRSSSLGLAVMLFFWSMIYGTIIFGIYLAQGADYGALLSGEDEFPGWIWASLVFSPMDMYQVASMLAFDIEEVFGISMTIPGFISLELIVFVQLIWTIIPLILASYIFEKKDI